MRTLSVCPFGKFTFSLLDGGFTGKMTCPPEKEGNSKRPKGFALKMSNFGIHFWPRASNIKNNEGSAVS
jgi:hypothetical protein